MPIAECRSEQVCYRPDAKYVFDAPGYGLVESTVISQGGYIGNHSKSIADSVVKDLGRDKYVRVFYDVKDGKVISFINRQIDFIYMVMLFVFGVVFSYVSFKWCCGKAVRGFK